MRPLDRESALREWTLKNSEYDERRNYIGLSTILDCPRAIYNRFFSKTSISIHQHLRTKYSYELERIIRKRLAAIVALEEPRELSLFGGLVKGHTDGAVGKILLEIKTVQIEDHFPIHSIPTKVNWQCQAYMTYGNYDSALVLYFSRENGAFRVYGVHPERPIITQISRKLNGLVASVKAMNPPIYICGRCQEVII